MTEIIPAQPGNALELLRTGSVAQLSEHASFGVTGLVLADGASEAELDWLAGFIGTVGDAACFAVGDIANFYRAHYPEFFQTWIERPSPIKGLDNKTVRVYAAVSKFYPHDQRARHLSSYEGHPGVSFSHFSRVRRYGQEVADYWLERAATEGLSLEAMESLIEADIPGSDDVPTPPEQPISKQGEAYWLGPADDPQRHLLVCGDSTLPELAAYVQHLGVISMVWTDPPYGVDYIEKIAQKPNQRQNPHVPGVGRQEIAGDTPDAARKLMRDSFTALAPYLVESCPIYIAGPSADMVPEFIGVFGDMGWRYEQLLVWVKQVFVMGRMDYHWQHESIYYGHTSGPPCARTGSGKDFRWFGPDNASSVFFVDRPRASEEHPTMKPTKLIRPAIENGSKPGDIVADPFAGSGSTLIAAEQTGRRAFVIEYDERYADVIRQRYADYLALQDEIGASADAAAPPAQDFSPGAFDE